MKSLKDQLSGNSEQFREPRVQNFIKMLCEQSRGLIEIGDNGKNEYRKLQMKIESLVSVTQNSSVDLASQLTKTDVNKLIIDINDTAAKMYDIARIVSRRVAVHNRLFPDNPVEGLSKDELDFINDIEFIKYEFVTPLIKN